MSWKLGYLIVAIGWYIFAVISIMLNSDKPKDKITNYHFVCCVFAGLFWPLHMIFFLLYLVKSNSQQE